jgi:DNA-binding CsgD family transcriptional regulator
MLVIGCDKRVRWANARGQELLSGGNLVGINALGQILSPRAEVRRALASCLEQACRGEDTDRRTATVPVHDNGQLAAKLTLVVPAMTSVERYFAGPSVVLLVDQGNGRRVATEQALREAFALTPREAQLARTLAKGAALAEAAAAHGVSRETARTQLKHVFAKLEVHRQAELVAKIRSLQAEHT